MQSIQQIIETILNDVQGSSCTRNHYPSGGLRLPKEGTWMLLREDGVRKGIISGGCLENDLHNRAMELFKTGKSTGRSI